MTVIFCSSLFFILVRINKVEAILRHKTFPHNNVVCVCVEYEGGAWTNDDVMVYMRVGVCGLVRGEIFILSDLYSPSLFFTHLEKSLFFDDRSIRENEKIWTHMLFLPSSFGTR